MGKGRGGQGSEAPKNRQERGTIIKYSALRGARPRRRLIRHTKNLPFSGIQISFKMKKIRKMQKRNLWTLQLLKRFSQILKCVRSMILVRILLTRRVVVVTIHSDMVVNSFTSPGGIRLEVVPSSLNSTLIDLMAFTQNETISCYCYYFYYVLIMSENT